MGLDAALSIAGSGIANIGADYTVLSNNVANANTPGYAAETAVQASLDAGGQGLGATLGPTQIATDAALQNQVYAQAGLAAGAQTTSVALAALQNQFGTVGGTNDLGSLVTNLQNAFSALQVSPSNGTAQIGVVSAAGQLANQINTLSASLTQARQTAQDQLVTQVGQLNTALSQVGELNTQIIALRAQGSGSADLDNQLNSVLSTISGLTGARFQTQNNGSVLIFTGKGTQLPTNPPARLAIAPASAGPTVYYPGGGLGGITLSGLDVTTALAGGSIAANVQLRDTTLPTFQATLDSFSFGLANRFAAQGLSLFTDPQGNLPAATGATTQAGYVGFATDISVNPQVVATPSLVRDGNLTIAGSTTGASAFTPNPQGLAGFTGLVSRVLNFSLGADVQTGVVQPSIPTTGLGPSGTLQGNFAAGQTLTDFANAQTASAAAASSNASSNATEAQATLTSLSNSLQGATGVDIDSQLGQLVQLQDAYAASARIIATVQTLYTDLFGAVTG